MTTEATLLMTRSEVASLLGLAECIGAVEEAFRLHAQGLSLPPSVLETLTGEGGFHIKAAGLRLAGGGYFAAKVNANFPPTRSASGCPPYRESSCSATRSGAGPSRSWIRWS